MVRAFSPAVALLALLLCFSASLARQATPAAGLVTPDPAECQVEPRSLDELTAFLPTSTPAATPATADATPAPFVVPEGEPADPETVAGVTETATMLFACYNANDLLCVFALFTDDYLMRAFADEGMTDEGLGYFAMPAEPRPEAARESISVQHVHVREDGRIGALLVGYNPEGEGSDFTDYTVFVQDGDRFLIDDVVFLP